MLEPLGGPGPSSPSTPAPGPHHGPEGPGDRVQSADLRTREEAPDGCPAGGAFLLGRSSVPLLSRSPPLGWAPSGAFFQGCLSRGESLAASGGMGAGQRCDTMG